MLPQDVLTVLNSLDKRLKAIERYPQPSAIQLSTTSTASTTLAAGASVTFTMTLTNANNLRLLGTPFVTVYLDSVAVGNEVEYGTGDAALCSMRVWTDWGTTDNNDLVCKAKVINNSANSHSFLFRGNWRFSQANGASS